MFLSLINFRSFPFGRFLVLCSRRGLTEVNGKSLLNPHNAFAMGSEKFWAS